MDSNQLISIWEKGNKTRLRDNKLSKDMITNILDRNTHKALQYFSFNIVFHWLFQLIGLVLISMNLIGYKGNTVILWVLGAQLMVTLGVILYGIFVFIRFREITNYSKNLKALIETNLHFFKTHYEAWIFLIAFTLLILIFNLNILVDNTNGLYTINNVGLFIMINIGVFIFIYFSQKLTSEWKYKALKANLHDLNAGLLDESRKMEATRKRYVWVYIVIAIVLAIVFIVGLIKAIQF